MFLLFLGENFLLQVIFHQVLKLFAPCAQFDRGHLDSLTEVSWQGDSLALTEDEVTVLMEEIVEEEQLLDVR